MSQSQSATPVAPLPHRSPDPSQGSDAIEFYFEILEDAACRNIIEATSERRLSAKEIADTCDLPTSTTYRKLDHMTEAGLLEEGIRIKKSGKHTSEYGCVMQDVTVSIGGDGGINLRVETSS